MTVFREPKRSVHEYTRALDRSKTAILKGSQGVGRRTNGEALPHLQKE